MPNILEADGYKIKKKCILLHVYSTNLTINKIATCSLMPPAATESMLSM